MFSRASNFNQNIATWNVSQVTNMSEMFNDASAFTQVLAWEGKLNDAVTQDMKNSMFTGAGSGADLSS